ncbi:putative heat shock protein Hsp20 [Actinoplanes missouriensis 431]|uniref:Putative heat shock protein Hsp20 n=1 Tax=Actinoplanes missouriensis (strain ATCC 14538 / DSM 43046 / CBS 188.64 / JCM 3121 / NBRC 102363 / NCIMB 12654 / NRRL B-3342 / UNCC 431) TaxID=512565 RepID=I0HFR5_ACTM4|nr:Hsp20/alpha crystallin family protein [Actinoplanes missouriensis]BAL91852.1 putative heat shock protein Hsp20 [Actinoplanes missouriensis 431]
MLLSTPTVRDLERLTARVYATRESGARLDAYRRDDTFFIDIDLPGIDPATIDITVDGKVLTVRAERKRAGSDSGGSDVQLLVVERPMGNFSRQVQLSEKLDVDRLEARHDNGVLTLRIPVLEQKPRKIELVSA